MNDPSVIFLPVGGTGEFADIAERIRAADPVPMPSLIVPIQHTHVEWINVCATHLGLEAMDAHGSFLPLVKVPLEPFTAQPEFGKGLRHRPIFRLSWYGHPVG